METAGPHEEHDDDNEEEEDEEDGGGGDARAGGVCAAEEGAPAVFFGRLPHPHFLPVPEDVIPWGDQT